MGMSYKEGNQVVLARKDFEIAHEAIERPMTDQNRMENLVRIKKALVEVGHYTRTFASEIAGYIEAMLWQAEQEKRSDDRRS